MNNMRRQQRGNFVPQRHKMYGSGEIVATVNDYLFTNWAFSNKMRRSGVGGEGGGIMNSAAW